MLGRALLETTAGRVAVGLAGVLVLAVAAGLAALWPGAASVVAPPSRAGAVERAEVVGLTRGGCEQLAGPNCRVAQIQLDSGARASLTLSGDRFAPPIQRGDHIRVTRNAPGGGERYAFSDFERSTPLLALALVFGALVVVLGRWHGVRALAGLGLSLGIVVEFLAPHRRAPARPARRRTR